MSEAKTSIVQIPPVERDRTTDETAVATTTTTTTTTTATTTAISTGDVASTAQQVESKPRRKSYTPSKKRESSIEGKINSGNRVKRVKKDEDDEPVLEKEVKSESLNGIDSNDDSRQQKVTLVFKKSDYENFKQSSDKSNKDEQPNYTSNSNNKTTGQKSKPSSSTTKKKTSSSIKSKNEISDGSTKKKKASSAAAKKSPATTTKAKAKAKTKAAGTKVRKKPTQKVKPKPRPVVVDPPEFSPITTDISEDELQIRLFIREYVYRFEKHLRPSSKHLNILNDPTGYWPDTTFKAIAVVVLKVIYADNYPVVPELILKNAIKEVEKTASDSEKIWRIIVEVLQSTKHDLSKPNSSSQFSLPGTPGGEILGQRTIEKVISDSDEIIASGTASPSVIGNEDIDRILDRPSPAAQSIFKSADHQLEKLEWLQELISLSLTGNYIRETLEIDQDSLKQNISAAHEEIKALKDANALELINLKVQALQGAKAQQEDLRARYAAIEARNNRAIKAAKEDVFRRTRKLSTRTLPLGTDVYGNTYWLFEERTKSIIGWGSWIMCNKAVHLPSPTGQIIFPIKDKKPGDGEEHNANDDHDDDAISIASSGLSSNILGDNTNWYAIKTNDDAVQLHKWIRYIANKRTENKPQNDTVLGIAQDIANGHESWSESEDDKIDEFFYEVYSDHHIHDSASKSRLCRLVATKESIETLAKQISDIAEFLPSREPEVKEKKLK
ncbi:hypothetical protein V1514DRAFT_365729 [Lipomyces japonicus]|uniref:uncharacterized protein n=1 Tax=Lipomyces japonicus TaxID=56871 RepID=UPI0034CFEF9C